ncbi:MAG: hypothetical protein ACHQ4G_10175, partial [Opitutales bacterium]
AGGGGGGGGGGRGGRGGAGAAAAPGEVNRPSGRGRPEEQDTPQGRPLEMASPPRGQAQAGEDSTLGDVGGGGRGAAPLPPELRPRIVVRFAPENELFVSGMLAGGRALANSPAVVDVPRGKGHVLLFANNPMWRNETQGSYFLLFNAMLNYDHLSAGVQAAPAGGRGGPRGGGQ